MAHELDIRLDWYEEYANVRWHRNGHAFEIGTLSLDRLSTAIIGFTYAHHMLPIYNMEHSKTLLGHRIALGFDRLFVELVKEKIQQLHLRYPEISVKKLLKDDLNDPQFYDQVISLSLRPINAAQFQNDRETRTVLETFILQRIKKYCTILGVAPWIEVLTPI